jgi:hypothetical protein
MVAYCRIDRMSSRSRCEALPSIDLAWLRRNGWIEPGAATSGPGVRIGATPDGLHLTTVKRQGSDVFIPYVWTSAGFGSRRKWLCCPGCQSPRRVLYLTSQVRCRVCLNLIYASQCEPAWAMRLARARQIRRRLGGPASIGEPMPFKPPTMHWKTYRRLVARCIALESAGLGAAAAALRRR